MIYFNLKFNNRPFENGYHKPQFVERFHINRNANMTVLLLLLIIAKAVGE